MENQMEDRNPFLSFVAEEQQPTVNDQMPEGNHLVTIAEVIVTTDKRVVEGETPDNVVEEKDWVDLNPVLYVLLKGEQGLHHLRLYFNGYKKYPDLIADKRYASQLENYRQTSCLNVRNYAIDKHTNERVIDERLSKYAQDLIHQFATAAGCVGKKPTEWLDAQLWVQIRKEFKFGKWRYSVAQVSFKDKPLTSPVGIAEPRTKLPKGLGDLDFESSKL